MAETYVLGLGVGHQPHSDQPDPRNLARNGEATCQLTDKAVSHRGRGRNRWDDPLGDEQLSHGIDNTGPRQQKGPHADIRLDLSPVAGLPYTNLGPQTSLGVVRRNLGFLEESRMQQDVRGFMGERCTPPTDRRPTSTWPLGGARSSVG